MAKSDTRLRIGIDLGGTKIECVALDAKGAERFRQRVATPRGDYVGTIASIAALVGAAEQECECAGTVGVGIPGAIGRGSGLVKNSNAQWLVGRNMRQDLESALRREVRVENDATCFAVSEATDGSGAGYDLVFAVIIGTGTGAGITFHGEAWSGRNNVAGEWGHNPLPWPQDDELPLPACYCGRAGCVELWLSGSGFARRYRESGGAGDARSIFAAAAAGDPRAVAAVERYEDRMARSLAAIVNVLDPDVIVLGGGMSRERRLYEGVPARLADYVYGGICDTPILPATHGDAGGVRGAAWLW